MSQLGIVADRNPGSLLFSRLHAYEKDTGRGVAAAFCKRHDGRILGAVYNKFKCQNAMQADCKGVELAIILTKKLQALHIVILGDNQNLMKTLAAGESTMTRDSEDSYSRLLAILKEHHVYIREVREKQSASIGLGLLVLLAEVLEARDLEYQAWAHVRSINSSLDEHNLESHVKAANEAKYY
ncbi:hypothetical protein IFM89_027536 [Coptis chinensis]|uniref:RNase H type-1 domain-containing protein n=1 Tax=Coptis chinensis TaxID=261450 RepID=A0A835LRP8_9MAGN|nr:hypothetical protein IFM89_027536 [Coptis chinensis]